MLHSPPRLVLLQNLNLGALATKWLALFVVSAWAMDMSTGMAALVAVVARRARERACWMLKYMVNVSCSVWLEGQTRDHGFLRDGARERR